MGISYPSGSISLYPPSGTLSNPPGSISTGDEFSPQAETLFAAMSPEPNDAQKAAINNFINAILGFWSKFDGLYVLHSYDSQPSLLNWKNPAQSAVTVAGPVFTAYSGWQGDGVGAYITIPTTFSQFATNSGHFASSTAVAGTLKAGNTLVGDPSAITADRRNLLYSTSNGTSTPFRCQSSTTGSTTVVDLTKLCAIDRSDATGNRVVYSDGAAAQTVAVTSGTIGTGLVLLRDNVSSYGDMRPNFLSFGASLTAPQHATLNSALKAYISAMVP